MAFSREVVERREALRALGLRPCSMCKNILPLDNFYTKKCGNLRSRCILCCSVETAMRKYNLSRDQVLWMWSRPCDICGLEPEDKSNIDHDHKTGEVRGSLCTPCNTILGTFDDDRGLLLRAAEYLR